MKRYIAIFSLLSTALMYGDVLLHQRPILPKPVHPIEPDRPHKKPIVRPIVVPHVDTAYINNTYVTQESCDAYKQQIEELNAYIDELEKEIHELKEKEYAKLRQKLKEKHAQEMQEFEKRKSSVKTKNTIIVKDKAQ